MTQLLHSTSLKIFGILICVVLLVCSVFSSIVFGVMDTSWKEAVEAYASFNGTNEHIVIKEVRVPRALIAAAVGASLGIAGALLQALTKNPLADLSIFGINSGASFFIVIAASFFSVNSLSGFAWVAFAGAAVSGVFVYFLGSIGRDGMSPVKLTLAGAAMTALFSSLTHGLLTANERTLEEVLFWLSGSVAGRKLEMLAGVFPYMMTAWILALIIAGPINTFMLGEDVAKGLGQRTLLVKITTGITIILLSGSAVAVAGPIGFIGLIIPHIARFLVGIDTRWIVTYSALLGAVLLLVSDIGARFIAMPKEMPISVMTALIGAPFFVYVARKGLARS
ncbi:FecCD family ABC transporter permease [Effusibacillus lacus]|uniref:Iron ABC transporter n=1 Tax=Effusibacillus lacus TaxID=1348429 RepID=A0A292YNC7_9BACL|nr:iron ABC transporter permease [Effusibacillus lacus]TCS71450.1 iron complex transport system permease protein [Effusibacillus lacus]GAX89980.1 iron ABC transporter [Effusibacillus lacus]